MTGITAEKINTALGLIDHFENGEQPLAPQDAEQLVKRIFDACGYDVSQSGFVGGDQGVDCYFSGLIDGRNQTAMDVRLGRFSYQKVLQSDGIRNSGLIGAAVKFYKQEPSHLPQQSARKSGWGN